MVYRLFYLFFLLSISTASAQNDWSNYYMVDANVQGNIRVGGEVDVNQNVTINKNVQTDVTHNHNITTINYSELAMAYAEMERTKFLAQKYEDQRYRNMLIEIANDPVKALDYGQYYTWEVKKEAGWKRANFRIKIPHPSMLTNTGPGTFENVSVDYIKTQIVIKNPHVIAEEKRVPINQVAKEFEETTKVGVEIEGSDGFPFMIHKIDIGRSQVWSNPGFRLGSVKEGKYEKVIGDLYMAMSPDGIYCSAWVTYSADKDTSFELIEGRRYYMRRLVEQLIATSRVEDYVIDEKYLFK